MGGVGETANVAGALIFGSCLLSTVGTMDGFSMVVKATMVGVACAGTVSRTLLVVMGALIAVLVCANSCVVRTMGAVGVAAGLSSGTFCVERMGSVVSIARVVCSSGKICTLAGSTLTRLNGTSFAVIWVSSELLAATGMLGGFLIN